MKFKTWFLEEERVRKAIECLLDNHDFVMFFKKGDDVFGCGEDGRVTFAKIKHPDEECPSGWEKDANFSALNLNKAVLGDPVQHIFTYKDKIKIIDRDEAYKILEKVSEKLGNKAFPPKHPQFTTVDIRKLFQHDPDEAPNMFTAKERK